MKALKTGKASLIDGYVSKSQKASSVGIFSLCRALTSSSRESIRKATKPIIVVHNLLLGSTGRMRFPPL